MKIDITKAQLRAIHELKEDCRAMLGNGEPEADKAWEKRIKLIDRMIRF